MIFDDLRSVVIEDKQTNYIGRLYSAWFNNGIAYNVCGDNFHYNPCMSTNTNINFLITYVIKTTLRRYYAI